MSFAGSTSVIWRAVMSAFGTKRTCTGALQESAFGGKAAMPIALLKSAHRLVPVLSLKFYRSFANTRGRTNKKRVVADIFALALLSVPMRISPAPPFTRAKITGSPDHVFIGFIPT